MSWSTTDKNYKRIAAQVIDLVKRYHTMGDVELQSQTAALRAELASGTSLRSLLPRAYAVVCEAADRVLGMAPFPNQILGAVGMEYNNVVEMKTGEGKTLTAIMPMYLHGLTGPGNFLITANAYLATRDAQQMGQVYQWLGLTIMPGVAPEGHDERERDRRAIYRADIVYTTHSQLGFDYLFDNLAESTEEQYLQGFHFALLDEADEVLLDSASTPLVISGAAKVQSNLYQIAARVVNVLQSKRDFGVNEKQTAVWFTKNGLARMEHFLGVERLLSVQHTQLYRHLVLALKARELLRRNRDYVLMDNKVVLIDTGGGRQLYGMKLEAGLHQAIEAQEHVPVTNADQSMASITYQNMFRMFNQLSGMTGTAKTDAAEFREIYRLSVYTVPTHKPIIRQDHGDRLFVSNQTKLEASLDVVKEAYQHHRPVLIETGSVALSNLYSRLLLREGIPHNLLNAQSAAKEAKIVAGAGQQDAITVATSMAGRGTDIKLGDGVAELGGLLVLGTERMDNPRIDNQLRGRSGRQGDPGDSVFFSSLEDDVVQKNAPRWVARYRQKEMRRAIAELPLRGRLKHVVDRAQKSLMSQKRSQRFQTLEYGEVARLQRDSVYDARNYVLALHDMTHVYQYVLKKAVWGFLHTGQQHSRQQTLEFIYQNIDNNYVAARLPERASLRKQQKMLGALITRQVERQHQQLPEPTQWLYFQRVCLVKAIDSGWIEQVDNLESLKKVTSNRSVAQHNPVFEYQLEAQRGYENMKQNVYVDALRNLSQAQLYAQPDGSITVEFP